MQRGRTRVLNACQRCRKQKVRCSGTQPCQRCQTRGACCNFGIDDKHVLISERELFDLRRRLSQLESPRDERFEQSSSANGGQTQLNLDHRGSSTTILENDTTTHQLQRDSYNRHFASTELRDSRQTTAQPEIPNLLVPEQPTYLTDNSGKLRYLGHSSNYAFTQQVLQMLHRDSPANPSPEILLSSDGRIYEAESARLVPLTGPNISKLPSKRIAAHYLQCVKFRTYPLFCLFDDLDFNAHLNLFYGDPLSYAQAEPVWYAHFLVLMAIGRGLDSHVQRAASSVVVVAEHFTRALQLLPDTAYLCDRPIAATELLCCIALYLQSIDHRRAAIVYMGQAVRMAHMDGLHRDVQESVVGSQGVERRRRVWWTVYSLNQRLTSNIGLPNFINDKDITSPFPVASDADEDGTACAIHMKICQLLGVLISSVYSSSDERQKSFVSTTRTVLKAAAELAPEIRQYSTNCFGDISRIACHLELAHHQCILLACRPALFYLMKMHLTSRMYSQTLTPPASVTGLIQVCVDSATQAINTLSQLKEHDLLDTFLPFDLESGFSAAFVLILARRLSPRVLPNNQSVQMARQIIETIAAQGNTQAHLRRLEVEELEHLLSRQFQQTENLETSGETADPIDRWDFPNIGTPFFDEWYFDAGLSEDQIMDLAAALDTEHFNPLT